MKLSALAAATTLFSGSILAAPLALQTYDPQKKGILAVDSTLVSGPHEAVLSDAQFSVRDGEKLIDVIKKNSKPLIRVVTTSDNPDFYSGLEPLMKAFPQVEAIVTPGIARRIETTKVAKLTYRGPQMKDGAPTRAYVPQMLKANSFATDGEKVVIMQPHDYATFIWIRANKTIPGGTGMTWGMRLWTVDTRTLANRQQQYHTLDQIIALHPQRVIPGHYLGTPPEGDSAVRFIKAYLQQPEQASKTHQDPAGVIETIETQWSGLVEISSLGLSAKVNTGEMKWWSRLCMRETVLNLTCKGRYCPENGPPQLGSYEERVADLELHFIRSPPGLPLKPEQDKGVRMKPNRQAHHLLGLNYRFSQQKKVVLEGDERTTLNHIHVTGRERHGG